MLKIFNFYIVKKEELESEKYKKAKLCDEWMAVINGLCLGALIVVFIIIAVFVLG